MDEEVQIAARGSSYARFAFAGDANARALIDAGGNFHRQLALGERPAFAVTAAARVADHLAGAPAGRAAALYNEESLLRPNFTHAAAGLAGVRAMLGTVAAATLAALAPRHRLDRDRLFGAGEGLLEAQFQIVAKVRPASRILLRPRVHELAENGQENV